MRNNENAIEVINMYKDFKRVYDKPTTLKERFLFWNKSKPELFHVLKDINIEIKKGETVALIGTNGSGKSTLLKLMTRILYPTRGTLETNGKLTSLLELGAGFHPDFTGRENIYFNASIFGLTKTEIDKRLDDIIEFSELGGFIDNPVRTYSSGMYMRLAFSVAINVDAEILLIDEILAVGDQHFQDKCFAKLEELRDSDKTIVIVSHSLDVIRKLCKRAIWIYDGNVMMDGEPNNVIDCYLERVIEDHKDDVVEAIKANGIINIDSPTMQQVIDENEKEFVIAGWEVSNVTGTLVKVLIDGTEVQKVERLNRPDVMLAYQDQYGGVATNTNAGWKVVLKTSDFLGRHSVHVVVYDKNENVISQGTTAFVIN